MMLYSCTIFFFFYLNVITFINLKLIAVEHIIVQGLQRIIQRCKERNELIV